MDMKNDEVGGFMKRVAALTPGVRGSCNLRICSGSHAPWIGSERAAHLVD